MTYRSHLRRTQQPAWPCASSWNLFVILGLIQDLLRALTVISTGAERSLVDLFGTTVHQSKLKIPRFHSEYWVVVEGLRLGFEFDRVIVET